MIKNLSIILLITLALSFTVKDNFKGIKRRGPPPYD